MNPGVIGDNIPWGYAEMSDFRVYNCSAGDTALFVTQTGGWLTIYDVSFINNFGLNTASIALADI